MIKKFIRHETKVVGTCARARHPRVRVQATLVCACTPPSCARYSCDQTMDVIHVSNSLKAAVSYSRYAYC